MKIAEVRIVPPTGTKGNREFDLEVSSDKGETWATLPTAATKGGTHELDLGDGTGLIIAQVPVAVVPPAGV